jgi:protein-L-isoaspartate(D-aspartate) O-methyltransferase
MTDLNIEQARFNMIEQQIRTWDVLDLHILDVLSQTPREEFVPEAHRALAFADLQIPLGHGQNMLHPKMEGRILQTMAIKSTDRILEIGTGSGYLTACLAKLGSHVDSVDIQADFIDSAALRLETHNIGNVTLAVGDAAAGWPQGAPYDVIVISGSLPVADPAFQQQLAPGGRLFMVTGSAPAMQAWLITRVGANDFSREVLFETVLPPLINAAPAPQFAL